MTTSERRVVISTMRERHAVSERRVCRVLGFERTALRYTPTGALTDAPLRAKLRELVAAYPRWSLPRLHWRLQRSENAWPCCVTGWMQFVRCHRIARFVTLVRADHARLHAKGRSDVPHPSAGECT